MEFLEKFLEKSNAFSNFINNSISWNWIHRNQRYNYSNYSF
jgi:hypothetical protein